MRCILTGIVLTLMLTGGVAAGPFEDCIAARSSGDYATRLRLLRPLAEEGEVCAQDLIGSAYAYGMGVPMDYAEAIKWHRLAAEQGYAPAQSNLGLSYEIGRGVPQDYVQAHMWFNLAASRFSASMADNRNIAIELRDDAASKMTPAQIAEAQKLAREWKPKASPSYWWSWLKGSW